MKHKSIFFSISLIFSSFCLSAQELPKEVVWQEVEGVNVPIPPQTHPRLYVRSSDLPALKERVWAGSGGAMPCWWGWPCP